ncbi:MAG: deoxyribodipyrimidine photo-lyase/cryptochrome family protein [Crocinitomicaceae bacterium]
MPKQIRNIVWLKRDLRTQDHLPLLMAERDDHPYLIVYLFEPSMLAYPDTAERHLQFIYGSINEMNRLLDPHGKKVHVFYGEATDVFTFLASSFSIKHVWSYQESGIRKTWDRDKQVKLLLDENNACWTEFQRDGIERARRNRTNWEKQWFQQIKNGIIQNDFKKVEELGFKHPFELPKELVEAWSNYPKAYQPPGERYAWAYLKSFAEDRGSMYSRHISKPLESRTSCGRISPYLAWGNMSIRQAYTFVRNHSNYTRYKRAMNGFLTRLIWHCHFIQKFEMECEYEDQCINRGYELLEYDSDQTKITAWESGTTGYPLVDASMRCLKETGWVNFRMRSMLVSFFCHRLGQNWKDGVYFLARQFLDYEPGIHYPQFQMQAGTTGINMIRIYNPVKQSTEHDPKGVFIKKWVPELSAVHDAHIHEPWKMTSMEQTFCGVMIGTDYPAPIVDLNVSGKLAREKMWGHRKHPLVRQEKQRVLGKHTNANRAAFRNEQHD